MKVCFVGVGSIATRHIRNLSTIFEQRGSEIQIDCLRHKRGRELPKDVRNIVNMQYFEGDKVSKNYDVIFVTNPTSLHYETLENYKDNAKAFFIEKPVYDLDSVNKENPVYGKPAYVAAPIRYYSNIKWLKNNLDISEVIGVRCICSSYLPEWRAGADYRKCYSAIKELGGGVKTDLIHEWDYLQFLFGFPKVVKMLSGKKSELEIDTEDIAIYIAEYAGMTIELHLDYYGRVPRRELEIFTKDEVIVADIMNPKIRFLNSGREIMFSQDRNSAQIDELKYAIDVFEGKKDNTNSIETAQRTLLLTEGVV